MTAREEASDRFRTLVADLVRKSLAAGHVVEIEGIGTFRSSIEPSGCSFTPEHSAQVFVAYAAEDLDLARRLCESLRSRGCSPWLDREQLVPGQNWPRALERAIDVADAFVACFSSRSVAKHGQFQCELRYAIDCARRRPLDEAFLIPIRFDECRVPRRLAEQIQYGDLFPEWDRGVDWVAQAVKKASKRKPVATWTE